MNTDDITREALNYLTYKAKVKALETERAAAVAEFSADLEKRIGYDGQIAALNVGAASIKERLELWAAQNGEAFAKAKSIVLGDARIGWRATPPKLALVDEATDRSERERWQLVIDKLCKWTASKVERLREASARFLQMAPVLDKREIIAARDDPGFPKLAREMGVEVVTEDQFYIERA